MAKVNNGIWIGGAIVCLFMLINGPNSLRDPMVLILSSGVFIYMIVGMFIPDTKKEKFKWRKKRKGDYLFGKPKWKKIK